MSFAAMARAIERHAREEVLVLQQCEELAARLTVAPGPHADLGREPRVYIERPGIEHELAALRSRAAAAAEAHQLLQELARSERTVCALLAVNRFLRRLQARRNRRT